MIRRPPRSTLDRSSAASDVYKRQIYTFAFGATLGIGTLFYLAVNGANIASVVALSYTAGTGFGNDLVTFMVGHGVVELSCIFIAGGAGLLIGSAMIMPGDLTRADALKTRGMEAVRLMIGAVSYTHL